MTFNRIGPTEDFILAATAVVSNKHRINPLSQEQVLEFIPKATELKDQLTAPRANRQLILKQLNVLMREYNLSASQQARIIELCDAPTKADGTTKAPTHYQISIVPGIVGTFRAQLDDKVYHDIRDHLCNGKPVAGFDDEHDPEPAPYNLVLGAGD